MRTEVVVYDEWQGVPVQTTPAASASRRLIGRDRELAALDAAAAASSSLVLVEGEAGVGKTSLVETFAAAQRRRGRRVYIGQCHALREPLPLMPLIDVLTATSDALPSASRLNPVAGALSDVVPELSRQLPPLPESLGDPWAERHRVFRAALEVLAAVSPASVIFEDCHWGDEGTFDFLRFLVPQLPEGVGVIITYRPEDLAEPLGAITRNAPPGAYTSRLTLEPLDEVGVTKLMSRILDVPVSRDLANLVHQRTGGVPFAVEEVSASLRERRQVLEVGGWSRDDVMRLAVPAALRDSILERLGRLSEPGQHIAKAAAVLGVPTGEHLLARTAGLSSAAATRALTEVLSVALLRETAHDLYDFRHALAGKTVYESIPTPARRRLHARAAAALGGTNDVPALAQIARHFKKAGLTRKWVETAEQAADRLLDTGDDETASRLLVDVLADPGLGSERGRLALKLGIAASNRLVDPQAAAALTRVLEDASLPYGVRGELHFRLGSLIYNQGDQAAQARAQLMQALPHLCGASMLAVRAQIALALPFSAQEKRSEHLEWLARATETAQQSRDEHMQRLVQMRRPSILVGVADPGWRQALNDIPTAVDSTAERRDAALAYVNTVPGAAYLGHYDVADALITKIRDLYSVEYDASVSMPLAATGLVIDWATGRWSGLEERARVLLNTTPAIKLDLIEAELVIGLLLMAKEQLHDAEVHLGNAGTSALASGLIPAYSLASAGLARIALARRDPPGAFDRAAQGIEVLRRKAMWGWGAEVLPVAVEALLRSGRGAEGEHLVEEFAAGLEGRDAPAAQASLLECRALVWVARGVTSCAATNFADAEAAWLQIRRPYDAALVRENLGRVLADADRPRAAELIQSALDDFARLPAPLDYNRTRAFLRSLGVTPPSRAGRKAYGVVLSPREAEVVELAALGKTNHEIAETLVLSHHTVAKHLLRGMHKLGVRSRAELRATVRDTTGQSAEDTTAPRDDP